MRKIILTALGAATMLFAIPAAAQDIPLVSGNFWNVAEITIDDGHFSNYADFLAGQYRKNMEFQKSKAGSRIIISWPMPTNALANRISIWSPYSTM
jgi:hypothetical protein